MSTLTPKQREAYEAFQALWKTYGMSRPQAHKIFCDLTGYAEIPYFMQLDILECEKIIHILHPDRLKLSLASVGRETGVCQICNRELTDPLSIKAGIGPVCKDRLHAPTELEDLL